MKEQQSANRQEVSKASAYLGEGEESQGLMMVPPVLQLMANPVGTVPPIQQPIQRVEPQPAGKSKAELDNEEVDSLLAELTEEVQEEMEAEASSDEPQSPVNRELIRDPEKQTGNSGRELIKQMLRMKEMDYKYVWIKGLKKKKAEGKRLTPLERKLLKQTPKIWTHGVEFANFGGTPLKKPKGLGTGEEQALTTNCSTAVQEALFNFLGGYGGSVDGVALTDKQFKNQKAKKDKPVRSGKNFQDKSWVKYLITSGLGYRVKDTLKGLQPGDIISTGGHRLIFLGYVGKERTFKKGPRKGKSYYPKARVLEAAMTDKKQGQSAIKDDREIRVANIKQAGRLYDFKE